MRVVLLYAKKEWNRVFTYKFNFFFSIITWAIGISLSIFTWSAIYKSSSSEIIAGYSYNDMMIYIILSNLSMLLYDFSYVTRLGSMIRSGKLTQNLIRPISIYKEFLGHYIGRKVFFIVIYIAVISFFVIKSLGINSILLAMYSIVNYFMFFNLIMFFSTLGFWTIQMWPLRSIFSALILIMGGGYFPLDILPHNIYKIVKYNPFSILIYNFSNALQGKLDSMNLFFSVITSLTWLILFYLLYLYTMKIGMKKYEGVGL